MSNFFSEEQLNNVILTKENNIENVRDFSRLNPNITLGDVMGPEKQKEPTPISFNQLSDFNKEENKVAERAFKKQEDKDKAVIRARVKIFVTSFVLITLLITGFVIYNLIAIATLNNKIENNNIKIKSKQEQIEREEQQPANVQGELDKYFDINLNNDKNKHIF